MKNKNLIAISGKISSGKDTVGKIIQTLTSFPEMSTERVVEHLHKDLANSEYKIKKFADKLKDIVCILIGCTREQLEDQEFKNTELEERWTKYRIIRKGYPNYYVSSEEEALREFGKYTNCRFVEVKMTPRLLLQLLGTDCGRNIIHPDVWVNALMREYKKEYLNTPTFSDFSNTRLYSMPKWIITDLRFENEFKAVENRKGITIRVNRPEYCPNCPMENLESQDCGDCAIYQDEIYPSQHQSETALDNAKFDYTIDNNSSIEDLIEKVREILIKEQIA